jgi:hypothetical protein
MFAAMGDIMAETKRDKMTLTNEDGELSPDLKAYFDSKGEKPMPGSDQAKEPANEPATEAEPEQEQEASSQPEAGAEPASKPDHDDDDDNASAPSDSKDRRVKWSAYDREKRQRKETEARLAKVQEDFARMIQSQQHREAMLFEKMRAAQPAPEPAKEPAPIEIPDPESDIFGATKYAIDRVKQIEAERANELAQRAEAQRNYEAQRQQADNTQRLVTAWRQYGAEKQQADPDFWPAYTYMTASRKAELIELGMDERSASRQVALDELSFIQRAAQSQQDPAELMKAMARARINTLQRQRGPIQPAGAPEAPKAANRLDMLAKGQEAHKTLTGVGSPGSARGTIGGADLAKMTHEEMETFLDKHGDKGFRTAMTR